MTAVVHSVLAPVSGVTQLLLVTNGSGLYNGCFQSTSACIGLY